jgi:hypothetical protein
MRPSPYEFARLCLVCTKRVSACLIIGAYALRAALRLDLELGSDCVMMRNSEYGWQVYRFGIYQYEYILVYTGVYSTPKSLYWYIATHNSE